jgi:hypothetical protein
MIAAATAVLIGVLAVVFVRKREGRKRANTVPVR